MSEIHSPAVVKQLKGQLDADRCAGCRTVVPAAGMVEHQLICPVWAGDGEPDWGCKDCLLVWIGPRGNVCARCHGVIIVSFH